MCDVGFGTAPDCNTNSRPDTCEIAGGTAADAETNGTPDECEGAPLCATCLGDLTGDNVVCGNDVQPFIATFIAGTALPCADFNANGTMDAADLNGFINKLLFGPNSCI